jgi:hypothetical protein
VRAALLAVVAALAAGVAVGLLAGRESAGETTVTETAVATETVTVAETVAAGLPEPVERTRAALLAAAEAGDYEALRPHLPADGFSYTFGAPAPGGPVAYWRELERTTDERPLETLAAVLRLPYTLSRGLYVWPFAYDLAGRDELTAHERELLAPLGGAAELFVPGTGYLGWRAGIRPDGSWAFFVAGD